MRVDNNQKQIVEALRKCGASVKITAQVPNFVDLVVGYRGKNLLIEIKTEKGKLRQSQSDFINKWQGKIIVLRTIQETINLINNWSALWKE